jgi:NADH dehydrogenase
MTTVSVFGGTGFLGRRLVRRLAAEGTTVRVAVRRPDRAQSALRAAGLEQVMVCGADVRDQASVAAAVAGGRRRRRRGVRLSREGRGDFRVRARARRQDGRSGGGELVVQQEFSGATIVRPGAMFGPGNALFGALADIARLFPVVPLIGGGRTRLQPAYVEDAAEAIVRILADRGTAGRTYELAGPTVYTLRELVGFVQRLIGRPSLVVPVPFAVAEVLAQLLELLPSPPLTTSQVDLLKADNVASGTLPGFQELDIEPKTVEEIVPTYVGRVRAPQPD